MFPLTPDYPTEDIYQIERTYVELNDKPMSLVNLRKDNFEGFELNKLASRLINDGVLDRVVTFEMSLKRKFYKRSVYNVIDFLADIGGLFNSFRVLAFVMVSVFQYWGSY